MVVDESGFELLPARVRTWAPMGQTPVLRVPYVHEHLTVISGITPDTRLYGQVLDHAVRGPDCVRFLWHLLRHIEGPLTVLWDGLPPPRGQACGPCSPQRTAGECTWFPAYAPELNPEEGVWKHLKYVERGNVCCQTLGDLKQALRLAMERLPQKPSVILGCFQQCGFV